MSQLFRLKNGTVLLSTEAPGGIYNSGQLKKIAELCSKELAIVKATEDQRLALFVKESEVDNVAQQLRAMGLGFRHYQDSLHQPVSCLGELCEEHEQPAMATAMEITKEIASIQLNAPLKIGVNGCARCCTPCHTLDIAVVGDASGYRISLGGKTRQMPEFASYFAEGVPPKELPKRLKAVIEVYKGLAETGETLHDVIERCGVADFVQALAPYSQDAAQLEDPFAKEAELEAAAPAVLPDASEDESPADDELSLEDADLSIADESNADSDAALDEIPILKEQDGSLQDDLDLTGDTPEELDIDHSAHIPEDDIDLDAIDLQGDGEADPEMDAIASDELELSEADGASDDLSLGDDLNASSDELDLGASDEGLSEDLVADELNLSEDLSDAATDELDLSEASVDDLSSDDLELSDASTDDLNLSDASTDDLDFSDADLDLSDASTDDLDLGAVEEANESEPASHEDSPLLDESLDTDLTEDLDETSLVADAPVDEDLEGIPELDEDLAPEQLPVSAAPVAAKKPVVTESLEDFGDELPGDVPDLSDEEENQFEQKLHASIDEESRMIAKADKDPNMGDRQAALSFLEKNDELGKLELSEDSDAGEDMDLSADGLDAVNDELEDLGSDELDLTEDLELAEDIPADDLELSEDLATDSADQGEALANVDEELEPINEPMEEFPEPGPSELAHIKGRQLGQKLQGSGNRQQFKVSAISFQDEHMRVTFESGAYVDFDLSTLGHGEERSFRLGVQSVSVTSTSEGYILEVDGMRLFHPKSSLPAAS